MQYEVENKYRVMELPPILQRLTGLGASFHGVVEQVDVYFSHPDRDFATTDEALRLRRVGDRNWVTYKGPKIDQATKTRREIELPLADGAELVEAYTTLLAALGFPVVAQVKKCRRQGRLRWKDYSVDLSLDEVAGLGQFVELEIVAETDQLPRVQAAVVALADELGLAEPERRSYLEMLLTAE
ncbi:MAG: class IV adenylate cyclase [Planctomycetota bacterium]